MSTVTDTIAAMKSQTAAYQKSANDRTVGMTNDSHMFLTLMLEQLQNQDPTEPTDNTEWLSQLAQYSSLEQMTEMNQGLGNCMQYLSALYNDMSYNSEITQTLSMIGKEVTLEIPDENDSTKTTEVKGIVTEASFKDGTGKVKVNGEYYSIAYITSIREADSSGKTTTDSTTNSANISAKNSTVKAKA